MLITILRCENKDPCMPNLCQNGAQCISAGANSYGGMSGISFTCQCPPGFTGQFCETCDPCIPNPCQSGGQCTSMGSTYKCTCPPPYMGQNCGNDFFFI